MRLKIIIPLIILIALAALWYLKQSQSTQSEVLETVEKSAAVKTAPPTSVKIKKPENKPNHESKSTTPELDQEVTAALALLEDNRYSLDPYIELRSIAAEYAYCDVMLMDLKYKDTVITDKRAQLLEQNETRCANLRKKYPFLGDRNITKKMGKRVKFLPSISALGDIYREDNQEAIMPDISGYLNRLTSSAIEAKNSQVLVQNADLLSQPFFKPDPAIAGVLGGLDDNYFSLIQQDALSLISCGFQGGISCQAEGRIMTDKCMANENVCGMNFTDWYKNYTTEAQKRDVETVINHYLSL